MGPLTKIRLAELRYKLAKARGILMDLINWETEDPALHYVPSTEEIEIILEETKDP